MIAANNFPSREAGGARRMPSQSQPAAQSQRQSSLSFEETAKA